MENLTVSVLRRFTNRLFDNLPRTLGNEIPYNASAPNSFSTVLIIRADSFTPQLLVNVYDYHGDKVYTIERESAKFKRWHVFSADRRQLATITIGVVHRTVDFPDAAPLVLRFNAGFRGKLHRSFFDDRGQMYSWNRRSRMLERISNPRGQHEERREKLAYLHPLRPNKLDWELMLNETEISPLQAITSSFITMKTQISSKCERNTSSGFLIHPGHPPTKRSPLPPSEDDEWVKNLVFRPDEDSGAGPRDFFNPPHFLEYKYRS